MPQGSMLKTLTRDTCVNEFISKFSLLGWRAFGSFVGRVQMGGICVQTGGGCESFFGITALECTSSYSAEGRAVTCVTPGILKNENGWNELYTLVAMDLSNSL